MLWLPDAVTSALGLTTFREENRANLGAAFVLFGSLVLAHVVWGLRHAIRALAAWLNVKKEARRVEEAHRRHLAELTPDEKAYLLPYIKDQANTQQFQIEDGIVGGLVAKGILYQASRVGYFGEGGWAFNMQSWARAALSENPRLLDGAAKRRPAQGRERI
jgi:hypothetical protein